MFISLLEIFISKVEKTDYHASNVLFVISGFIYQKGVYHYDGTSMSLDKIKIEKKFKWKYEKHDYLKIGKDPRNYTLFLQGNFQWSRDYNHLTKRNPFPKYLLTHLFSEPHKVFPLKYEIGSKTFQYCKGNSVVFKTNRYLLWKQFLWKISENHRGKYFQERIFKGGIW